MHEPADMYVSPPLGAGEEGKTRSLAASVLHLYLCGSAEKTNMEHGWAL